MTPRVAERLTIHVQDAVAQQLRANRETAGGTRLRARAPRRFRVIEGGEHWVPSTQRREALQRRLLAAADVIATTLALWLVLTIPGSGDQLAPLARARRDAAGRPRLQDRRPLRPRPAADRRTRRSTRRRCCCSSPVSTSLSVTILQSVLVDGTLGGDQILAPVGDELRRGRRAACRRPLGRLARGARRALPRHRRAGARRPDPREARIERRPRDGRRDVRRSRGRTTSIRWTRPASAGSSRTCRCTASSSRRRPPSRAGSWS